MQIMIIKIDLKINIGWETEEAVITEMPVETIDKIIQRPYLDRIIQQSLWEEGRKEVMKDTFKICYRKSINNNKVQIVTH